MGVCSVLSLIGLAFVAVSGAEVGGSNSKATNTVCYGDLGCFTDAAPWTSDIRPIAALPEDPSIINTRFILHTRANPTNGIALVRGDALGLGASGYDSAKKTVFLIHGWTNDAFHPWITSSVSEILINEDVNVIKVDWAAGAGLPYLRALTNTQVVGGEISLFILFLASQAAIDYSTIHLIGHDLGAHAASYAGQRVSGIGRITGLDPSTIYFEGADPSVRLDPTDAIFVDVVHSDASYKNALKDHIGLGFQAALGHVDVYVNNGQEQPGCNDHIEDLVRNADKLVTFTDLSGPIDPYVCSHMRSVDYFVESINSQCPFTAFSCSSWDSYLLGTCYSTCRNAKMCTSLGYHAGDYSARGVFYLDTQSSSPYCNIVLRVEVDISPNQAETNGAINYILIGDVGQTKEAELYKGYISNGFILSNYVNLPGSNAYRIGTVQSVRLLYLKDRGELSEITVATVLVQEPNVTINAVDNRFQGAVLPDGTYVTLLPS